MTGGPDHGFDPGMGLLDLGLLSDLAAEQDGVISIHQASVLGVDGAMLRRAGTAGILERVHPAVWRFRAAPVTRRQIVRASVLQVGPAAVASHQSALCLHGADQLGFAAAVTVPPDGNHRHADIDVHRLGDIDAEHLAMVAGIRTTTLDRAVIDVASVYSPARLRELIDRLTITERRLTIARLGRVLRSVNRHGRRGISELGAILDERSASAPAPRSRVERAVDALLDTTDLPEPAKEYPLPDEQPGDQFVDRAWPDARLILEVDGRAWHARERAMAKDRARDRAAARLGWLTLRVLDEEVTDLGDRVIDDVVATYRRRMADATDLGGI